MSAQARGRIFPALAIAAVVVAIAGGLYVAGSPRAERQRRRDETRMRDLRAITRAVNGFWDAQDRLPESLDLLLVRPGFHGQARDPATGDRYGYRVLGARTYELCAAFEREMDDGDVEMNDRFWAHGVGRKCFTLEAESFRR